ncbi:MAG: FAD-dependent oxidoreductase [bacterium]|nr:FAD-dependent oxidoreductase [bacterium]
MVLNERMSRADVAVIGGGVIGLACALELARRGVSVCVLERDRVGRGCSYGNAGWLTPSLAVPLAAPGQWRKALRWLLDPESPFYIRPRADLKLVSWLIGFLAASRQGQFERGAEALVGLCRASVDAWEEFAKIPDETSFGFVRDGLLSIFETPKALDQAKSAAEMTARFGVPFEVWTGDDVRDREPAVQGGLVGGIFFPREGSCEPYSAVRALADAARQAGVEVLEHAEVLDATVFSGKVRSLRTTLGHVAADEFVLAAGAWSGSLGACLGLRLPMLGAKGYSLLVPPLDPHPQRSLYLAERKIAINPHVESLRISGTLELVGEDLTVNMRRLEGIINGARGMLQLGNPLGEIEVWRGLRPCLPDGMPVIGRTRKSPNLWLATGHQMTGLKTAPGTGQLLADLMCGQTPSFNPDPFRADRYC